MNRDEAHALVWARLLSSCEPRLETINHTDPRVEIGYGEFLRECSICITSKSDVTVAELDIERYGGKYRMI